MDTYPVREVFGVSWLATKAAVEARLWDFEVVRGWNSSSAGYCVGDAVCSDVPASQSPSKLTGIHNSNLGRIVPARPETSPASMQNLRVMLLTLTQTFTISRRSSMSVVVDRREHYRLYPACGGARSPQMRAVRALTPPRDIYDRSFLPGIEVKLYRPL